LIPPEARHARFGEAEISLSLFERLAREIAAHGALLRLHAVGEPLLWSALPEALKLSEHLGLKSWVFSSGLGPPEAVEALKRAGIVEISLNGVDAEDYLNAKGISAYQQALKSIERLKGHTRLLVTRVESSDPAQDAAFVQRWSGEVDEAFIRSFHNYNGLLGRAEEEVPPPCLVHWGRFNISCDGQAVVCFNELFRETLSPDVILGDLQKQSIAEIWHGPKLERIRAAAWAREYGDLQIPCRNCSFCQPLESAGPKSERQLKALERR